MKSQMRGFIIGIITTMVILIGSYVWAMGTNYIEVSFDSIKLQINGLPVATDSILYNGTTYIPIRKVAEILDKEVIWDSNTFTANIKDKENNRIIVDINDNNEFVIKSILGDELYSFKINKITQMHDRYRYEHSQPAQVILIDFSYTNIANPSELYLSDLNFKIIDSAGKLGYTYPNTITKYSQRIPAGATCDAQMIYGLDNNSDTIKVHFYENRFGDTITSFQLKIEEYR